MRPLRRRALLSSCVVAAALLARRADAATYYVDGLAGSDAAAGTSVSAAWKTLTPVNAKTLVAGDVVSFRSGATYAGRLRIRQSGTATSPIVVNSYGTGAAPILDNAGGTAEDVVSVEGAYVIVEGLKLQNSKVAGVAIQAGAHHGIVRNCEVTNTGFGVSVYGTFNLVTRNYIHDLVMVRNTVGGDDDYGATATGLFGSDNEVSYNRFVRCSAPSYDYGKDGGGVELFGTVLRCNVHHNYAEATEGFAEIGGPSGAQVHDDVFAYNVLVETGGLTVVHNAGSFAVDVKRLRFENNTVLSSQKYGRAVWFGGAPTLETASLRNNLIVLTGVQGALSNYATFTHDHNLFFRTDTTVPLGVTLDATERVADPKVVDLAARDFHLLATSPAIDLGVALGHTRDFDGRMVPFGAAPDLGAFEYGAPFPSDGGPADAMDASSTDSAVTDTSVTDTSVTDTALTDTALTDTAFTDTSLTDTSTTSDDGGLDAPTTADAEADAGEQEPASGVDEQGGCAIGPHRAPPVELPRAAVTLVLLGLVARARVRRRA